MNLRGRALTVAFTALLLACGDDSATDAGADGSADATTQDVVVQDATGPDGSLPDGNLPDATPDAVADAAADGGPAFECTSTGGTIATGLCCQNTSDFPSTCTTGPCGCSPQNSHTVQTCHCPGQQCYTQQQGCH